MSFPGFAIGVQQEEQARARKQELADEKRKVLLKTLQEDAETPQDKVDAIQAVYHQDPNVLKQHVENLTRRLTGKGAQPVVSPADAQAGRLAPITARGKTPAQQQEEQYKAQLGDQQDASLAGTQRLLQWYQGLTPEQQKAAGPLIGITSAKPTLKEYTSPDGKQRQWFDVGNVPEGWQATGGAPKPVLPQLKQIKGHDVLYDPTTQKIVKDFGPHGSARVTNRQSIQYDADGTPHIVNLTSVSTPEGGQIDVDAEQSDEGKSPPKQSGAPAPRKPASGAPPKPNQLDFRKGTPAFNKAQGEYAEAVKLASIAKQVADHPNDAINQKRLAVALERTSAGRFTVQALDYIIKAGWGNTIQQWANNPTTGALPKDVMRQLIDGANENLKAAKDAVDTMRGPAPHATGGGGGVIVVKPEDMK